MDTKDPYAAPSGNLSPKQLIIVIGGLVAFLCVLWLARAYTAPALFLYLIICLSIGLSRTGAGKNQTIWGKIIGKLRGKN